MSEMQPYLNVIQVQELTRPAQVNKMLAAGWILLRTYITTVGQGNESAVYVIGWPRSAGAVVDAVNEAEKEQYNSAASRDRPNDNLP